MFPFDDGIINSYKVETNTPRPEKNRHSKQEIFKCILLSQSYNGIMVTPTDVCA